jgi:uncharacterized protein
MQPLSFAALAALAVTSQLSAACNDLIFSEYIEGSSYNKAVEIYNPTDAAIDLSAYMLELYSNGNETANATVTLLGSVAAGAVVVVSRSTADDAITAVMDIESGSVINFNGDDAVVLKKGESIVDAIGQVGVDPGSAWSVEGVSTKDMTLVRNTDVLCGDIDAADAFDPSLEWTAFDKDTFGFIGFYGESGGSGEDENETAATLTLIHDIQGNGLASPMVGETVTVEGIVVGDYQAGGFKGFYVQEEDADADADPMTSEAVYVYCSACGTEVNEGDLVRISGKIAEYSNLTEITSPEISVISSNNVLPEAVSVSLPVDDTLAFESVEGMIVTLDAGEMPLTVNENYDLGRYGSFTVGAGRLYQFTQTDAPSVEGYAAHLEAAKLDRLFIDDGSAYQNPDVIRYPDLGLSYENTMRSGDTIEPIVGVMDERYGSYRLQPTDATQVSFDDPTNARIAAPERNNRRCGKAELRVASFNVLNYFNTFEGCTYGVGGADADCRGADSAEEFDRQRTKIINAMLAIDADVYGLMEIENDGYGADSALADLVNGLNDAAGEARYAYIDVDGKTGTVNALGTDAIKVAFIYNRKTTRAKKAPYAVVLDTDDKNRPALVQLFKRKHTGRKVAVAVNHFKSKGSACSGLFYDGVEDLDQNDGQGNCNLTRTRAAEVLTEYIASTPALAKRESLLIGDFNAYRREDPIRTLEAAGYTDLVDASDYSYIFYGEAGTLDHALATKRLARHVQNVTTWHINTDEPHVLDYNLEYKSAEQQTTLYSDGPFRASDHDPVIIDLRW